jgi:hypothetical protein
MFIWGLVMAKAKAGFSASVSKDHLTVKSTLTKVVGMTVLIALASFAKLNAENHYIESWMGTLPAEASSSSAGRNLRATTPTDLLVEQQMVENLSIDDILTQLGGKWKQEQSKKAKAMQGPEPTVRTTFTVEEEEENAPIEEVDYKKAQQQAGVLFGALLTCGFSISYALYMKDYNQVV